MTSVTLDDVSAALKRHNFNAQLQEETSQLYFTMKLIEREFPVFARILDDGALIQLLAFLPANLKEDTRNDVARLLHLINKELDMPGFGLDEASGVIFFRVMVPSIDDKIHANLFDGFMNSLQLVCQTFSPAIEAVAYGVATFDEVLKKAQEHTV